MKAKNYFTVSPSLSCLHYLGTSTVVI